VTPRRRAILTWGIVVGAYALLLQVLFWRIWLRGQMSGWDCAVEYWPDLVFQIHALRDGEWPGWNPYVLGGYPYWADPQAGIFAPASWLTWGLAALGGDGPWLIQVKVLVNLLAGLVGMHAWTFARTRAHAAGAVAALVFVLGSPLLVHKNGALLWPVLYWPWALWALERFVAAPSLRRGAVLAGGLWLVGSAGHPQGFFYGLVVLGLYWGFLTLSAPSPRHAPRALVRQARGGAVALGLGALLLAATWVPAWSAVEASPRADRGPGYVLGQPLSPRQLDELWVPNLDTNWMHDVYVGALPIVGALWLLAVTRGRARASAAFWTGVAALGIVLALGRHGHLLPWLMEHVPGFDLFRIAYRHKLIFGLAAAVLAGDAVGALLAGGQARWTRAAWAALAAAWLAVAAAIDLRGPAWHLGAALLGAAAALPWVADRLRPAGGRRRAAGWALVALVPALALADLWHAGAGKLAILMRRPDPARHAPLVEHMPGVDRQWRYHVGNLSSPYGGTVPYHVAFLHQVREHTGHSNPIEPARHAEIERRARRAPGLLRHYNVRYFAGHRVRPPDTTPVVPGIVAAADVAPVARWYPAAEVRRGPEILDALAAAAPSQVTVAYVEAADLAGVSLPPAAGEAPRDGRVVTYGRGAITVEVDAPAPGVLVLNEAFYPGWTAAVDGRPARLFRAHYHLRAVVVPAGRVRVDFRYRPAGRVILPLLFVGGLLLTGVALVGRWSWLDTYSRHSTSSASKRANSAAVSAP
jgi:hypothetical protein